MANLKFDLVQFDIAITKYESIKTRISQKKMEMEKQINSAQTTYWNTEAGRKFEEISKGDWAGHIDQYVLVLDKLQELLATAKADYETVEEKVRRLQF